MLVTTHSRKTLSRRTYSNFWIGSRDPDNSSGPGATLSNDGGKDLVGNGKTRQMAIAPTLRRSTKFGL